MFNFARGTSNNLGLNAREQKWGPLSINFGNVSSNSSCQLNQFWIIFHAAKSNYHCFPSSQISQLAWTRKINLGVGVLVQDPMIAMTINRTEPAADELTHVLGWP